MKLAHRTQPGSPVRVAGTHVLDPSQLGSRTGAAPGAAVLGCASRAASYLPVGVENMAWGVGFFFPVICIFHELLEDLFMYKPYFLIPFPQFFEVPLRCKPCSDPLLEGLRNMAGGRSDP